MNIDALLNEIEHFSIYEDTATDPYFRSNRTLTKPDNTSDLYIRLEDAKRVIDGIVNPRGGCCHCATCTCNPYMTKAVRLDTSPAMLDQVVREHLIGMGWTPPQASAAQSAPAGEREAFCDWWEKQDMAQMHKLSPTYNAWGGWKARAAWQRTQSAGVPEGWRLVPVSSLVKIATIIDPAPGRMSNGDTMVFKNPHAGPALREISAEFRAMLAAAPAQPAAQREWPDDEIVAAWKWCEENGGTPAEFLSHSLLVKRSRVLGRPLTWREAIELTAMTTNMPDEQRDKLLAIDDEPDATAHDQGEVQRLREALEKARRIASNARNLIVGIRQGQNVTPDEIWRACEHLDALAVLAASTGQEVKP